MNDIVYTAVRLATMVLAAIIAKYAIPFLKSSVDAHTMQTINFWVNSAVMCAQQLMSDKPGTDRKIAVETFLRRILEEKGIVISDEQLDTLVESAVKQMKISEGR